jgi:hypothetical protein
MNISFYFTHLFESKYKRYKKKFHSLESDLKSFTDNLSEADRADLGGGVFKYRLMVKSKNKGKSGGFRIISFEILLSENDKKVTLLTIYDKSEQPSITQKEINAILREEGLI